ncbi:hypothetical protein [Paenibacillus thailandensis]|uniref:Sigma-70 family RNA polymerase sigma factor n=1 Tax=Paenibacillus thailandensis TaxID=393250 RepID=A0ABW5QRF1_9BACL
MALTDEQRERFLCYCKENRLIFSNRAVRSFFEIEENIELLLKALDGGEDFKKELEDRFRKHFFRIRFIKYLSSTIKFCTIDQMRLNQKNDWRNQLIFDRPASEEGDVTLGELLLGKKEQIESETIILEPSQFQASFSNEYLSQAFSVLSQKQQLITTLCYAFCYQDKEIARLIGVSPQAVGKTRNIALQKLRLALLERRGE